jgi:hypothetical protein
MRFLPTQTTQNGDSHRGLRRRWRGRVRAGDERSGHAEVDEVIGPERCSSGFDSPPSGGDGDSPPQQPGR